MSIKRNITAARHLLLVSLAIIPPTAVAQLELPQQFDSEIIDTGILFVNGQFVPPPYELATSEGTLRVNNVALNPFTPSTRPESEVRGRGRGRGPGTFGRGPGRVKQFRRHTEVREEGQTSLLEESSVDRHQANLTELLHGNAIVIAFDHQPLRSVSVASHQYDFMNLLLDDRRTDEQVNQASARAGTAAAGELWVEWLSGFRADPQLREVITHKQGEIDAAEVRSMQQIAATARLEQFSYPLTIAGMLLGVIAFGHMIQWIGRGLGEGDSVTKDAQRSVVVALGLMMGMSLIDLIWTILAGQAGTMRELNPVAAQLVTSPMQLAMLKVFATSVGFAILYAWRHRSQMQHATWWMCMVCVLLTFRWVMFDSMLN